MSVAQPVSLETLSQHAGLTLERSTLEKLSVFAAMVEEWDRRVNLTGSGDRDSRNEVLFLDAFVLGAHPELVPSQTSLIDVGAGAGAPVIPLCLMRDDLEGWLVEPRAKRCAFLRTALGALKLDSRLHVVQARVESSANLPIDGTPDTALSRATFAPETWLALAASLAPVALVFTTSKTAPAPSRAWSERSRASYTVPSTGASRRILRYERRALSREGMI